MGKFQDLTKQIFGRLVVIRISGRNKFGKIEWMCQCECGNTKISLASKLKNGETKSCGCLRVETTIKNSLKHGQSKTSLHTVWAMMKQRCYNQENKNYKHYGGRGVNVCDEWLDDFMNFYNWSMENGYKKGLTIDRIEVNGSYEPSNCRWITKKEQQYNKRNNLYITINGVTKTITEWAKTSGLSRSTIKYRFANNYP